MSKALWQCIRKPYKNHRIGTGFVETYDGLLKVDTRGTFLSVGEINNILRQNSAIVKDMNNLCNFVLEYMFLHSNNLASYRNTRNPQNAEITYTPEKKFSLLNKSENATCKLFVSEPGAEKTCLMSYANNKGADQPAHSRSLISIFVVRCLDSML